MVDDIPSEARMVRILPGQAPSVSVDNPAGNPVFVVFPNPASHEIFLQTYLANSEPLRSVSLSDVSGRAIRRWPGGIIPETDGRIRLSIPDCPAGTYFLNLETGNRRIAKKVVLQK